MALQIGDRFLMSRPTLMEKTFVDKMVSRGVTPAEVFAVLEDNTVFDVIPERRRYGLLSIVRGRALHLWVADDAVEDVTVLISVYEPDEGHGWSRESGWLRRLSSEEGQGR